MTRLAELRTQLDTVVRRRTARWIIGGSAVVLAVLWSLAVFFLLDWSFTMGRFERGFTLLIAGAAIAAAWWLLARPWFRRREDELDVALLVEKQRGIDSDLVAALQFEQPAARGWGSDQLRDAVIEYVTDYGKEWNLLADFPRDQMRRRALLMAITVLVIGGTMALLPQHTVALLNRLAFGSKHYPSRTQIRVVALGTERFPLTTYGEHDIQARRPFGNPIDFEVVCEGEQPSQGVIRARGVETGVRTTVALTKDARRENIYHGQLPRLVDTLSWSIELGDAWTDPAVLAVVPLPVVDLRLLAVPPAYASGRGRPQIERTAQRQWSVLEGSRVELGVIARNKTLHSATLKIGPASYPLASADADGHKWKLPPAASALSEVTAPVHYVVDVVDEDGLSLERPLEGTIGVEVDRPPRAEMHVATKQCWPGARPTLELKASDDYALGALVLHATVQRAGGGPPERHTVPVWRGQQPLSGARLPWEQKYPLDLTPMKLAPGDEVSLQLEARDYRGRRPGEAAQSTPEALTVTDELGAERAVTTEFDPRTEQLFNDIISRMTGIEGKR